MPLPGGPLPAPLRGRPRPRRPTARSGCSATAPRRRRARATRSRTGSSLSRTLPDVVPRLPRAAAGAVLPRRCARRSARCAPPTATNPRVVLLTPGPLQRDLLRARLPRALPRLHAGRGRRPDGPRQPVYLKMLGGLQPVDVILRRLDDDYCDPLELRARLVARRRRAGAGGARRQRRRGQRARQRRARDAGAAGVPARPLPAPARRGAARCRRCRRGGAASRGRAITCWRTSTSW